MGENSKIEWCDHTFNPWVGCTKVSAACDHCYAEGWAKRTGNAQLWTGERRRTTEANWMKPLQWQKKAALDEASRLGPVPRPRVFCASLADVFDAEVDPIWRENLFTMIDLTPNLDWLLLTKRPKLAAEYFDGKPTPPNIWMGTTVESQKMAKGRIRHLMTIDAPVRFLSMEPLLEPVQLKVGALPEWIIVGGESGPRARTMNPMWARDLRDFCQTWDVPFFFKQMTGKAPIPDDLMVREFPQMSPDRTETADG